MSGPALTLPLEDLERVLEQACGVALSAGVRQTLADGFLRAAREAGVEPRTFLRRILATDPGSISTLVEHAVVGETYFFRHPEQLQGIADRLLTGRPKDEPLAIWSAGCATGEEPYTVAMMLLEAGRIDCGDRILATDVSVRSLAAARAGLYGEWSLRRLDPALRRRFFKPSGRRLALSSQLRDRVQFRAQNLVHDEPPGLGFDLILCRNVLIYFGVATATQVLRRLLDALRPGGWLLLGPVETPLASGLECERIEVPGAMLLRRPASGRSAPPRAAAPPASRPADPLVEPVAAPSLFESARAAARRGHLAAAERLAAEAAARDLAPEAYLLIAMAAEGRGDLAAAVEAVRRALYLEPGLAQAHAALVPLFTRLGRSEEAARARRNALEALAGLDDEVELRGVEPVTVGALRGALDTTPSQFTPELHR